LLFTVAIGGGMSAQTGTEVSCCAVVELRQYTLKPQQRDVLIDLFDEHFVESQEALGMTVIGQFRDRGNADRFVWLRGFRDMESRNEHLAAFYEGPVWSAHRTEANNTMIDSDNVLLLKPARPDLAFRIDQSPVGTATGGRGSATVLAAIYQMPQAVDAELLSRPRRERKRSAPPRRRCRRRVTGKRCASVAHLGCRRPSVQCHRGRRARAGWRLSTRA